MNFCLFSSSFSGLKTIYSFALMKFWGFWIYLSRFSNVFTIYFPIYFFYGLFPNILIIIYKYFCSINLQAKNQILLLIFFIFLLSYFSSDLSLLFKIFFFSQIRFHLYYPLNLNLNLNL